MFIVKIDGFDIDISEISKKILIKRIYSKYYLTYALNFPKYTRSYIYDNLKELNTFLDAIKNDQDIIINELGE